MSEPTCCHQCWSDWTLAEYGDTMRRLRAMIDGRAPHYPYACKLCGNKRCPKAGDHRFKCTQSNEPDQLGELG